MKPQPKTEAPKLKLVSPAGHKAVTEFQTDAIALEERKLPVSARLTLYLVAAALACGVYWASVSRIDEIVIASGRLATTDPMLVMQPFETSIIRSIGVQAGDIVEKGQLLATLDPTFTAADEGQLRTRLAGLQAQGARIRAELAGIPYAPPPDASSEALMQGELAAQRQAAYQARLADYDARIAHGDATMVASRAQQAMLEQRLAGLEEIDAMRASLAEGGNGSRLALLQSRDVSLDLRVTLAQVEGQYAEAVQQRDQARAEKQNYIEDYRRLALEALVDIEDKQAGAGEELKKVELRTAMSRLVAPLDAAVLEVAQRSIASVVQPAEPLITLVPLNVPLEAEVTVAGNDIGHIANGDLARIKLDAFPFQEHGTLEGRVIAISENSFASQQGADPQGGAAFYKLRIALGPDRLKQVPPGFRLLPGMTVSAEIHAGERSVISYFLYPLIRGLDESLREP